MPSKTFLNLDTKKQAKLIDAAMQEFRNTHYNEVSINKIILTAQIPRGSFYMYFTDKEDLFRYLLELNQKRLFSLVDTVIKDHQGDLYHTFASLFDELSKLIVQHNYTRFMKNMVFYLSTSKEKYTRPGHLLFERIKTDIDTVKIKDSDLEFIFLLLFHNLLLSVGEVVKGEDLGTIKKRYIKKLNILCFGIYKEDTTC